MSRRDSNWHDPDLLIEMSRMLELPAAVTHVKLKTDGKGALTDSKRGHTSFDATAVVCVSPRDSNWHDPDLLNEMSRMLELPAAVKHVKLKTDGKGALTFLWWDEGVLLVSLERATPPRRVLNKACRLSGGSVG